MVGGQSCFLHTHACTEIIWYRGCTGILPQGDERLPYGDGDVAVYQPGILHGDECAAGGSQICIGVSGGRTGELQAGLWPADAPTRSVLTQLREQLDRHDEWRQERLNWLCGWLVLELRRQLDRHHAEGPRPPYPVVAARRIFDTRFAEPITIGGVAAELSINPDYLRQLFVQWVGESPVKYLIRKRLGCACDLLRLNQESNRQIAARVGIDNPYYFSRLFRQRFNMTPSHYRARYASE